MLLEQGGLGGEKIGAEAVATPCLHCGPMVDGYRDFVSSILTRSTDSHRDFMHSLNTSARSDISADSGADKRA